MGWCQGYGDAHAADDWLCPSTWLAPRLARD
jgi:hypothetical protein